MLVTAALFKPALTLIYEAYIRGYVNCIPGVSSEQCLSQRAAATADLMHNNTVKKSPHISFGRRVGRRCHALRDKPMIDKGPLGKKKSHVTGNVAEPCRLLALANNRRVQWLAVEMNLTGEGTATSREENVAAT